MATSRRTRRNRNDSSGENLSDSSSSDDDSYPESPAQNGQDKVLTDNSALLWNLSGHISPIWKQFGRSVGIKECIIENIGEDFERESEREKSYQLLLIWTRALGSKVTLDALVKVLVCMDRHDIAKAIFSNIQQRRFSVGSQHSIKREIKSHGKMQKQVLRKLKAAMQFYQRSLEEMEDLQQIQHRAFEKQEAQEMKAKLEELDKNMIQRKLDLLQDQISSMQGKDQEISELDQQLRVVADKLYELDKTFKNYTDALESLRFTYYSECRLGRICYWRTVKFPRTSSSGKISRRASKKDEETDDEVFLDSPSKDLREHSGSKTCLKTSFSREKASRFSSRRNKTRFRQEEHANRKLSVTIDLDEEFQLQDFLTKFCSRYQPERPFLYSHCFMNRGIQGLRDENPRSLDFIDPSSLPMPQYQSTETIKSLVTNGNHTTAGYINAASVWI